MANSTKIKSSKSIVIEILIGVLLVILFLSILFPKSQWDKQEENKLLAWERMENIFYATQFYKRSSGHYTDDMKTILAYAERESITVHPPGFKMDRLTLIESGKDSFQVEYFDPYQHFSHYEDELGYKYPDSNDSLVLTIKPKAEYPFAPVTYYTFASDAPISVMTDNRGTQGVYTMVGSQRKLRGLQILGEKVRVPAADYIYSIDHEDMEFCPSSGEPFNLRVNVKLDIIAQVNATFEPDTGRIKLSDSPLISSMAVYRMLRESDGKAQRKLMSDLVIESIEDSLINGLNDSFLDSVAQSLRGTNTQDLADAIYDSIADSYSLSDEQLVNWEEIRDASYALQNSLKEDINLQNERDEIVNSIKSVLTKQYLREHLDKLRSTERLDFSEVGVINTTSDSIDFYSNSNLIKAKLFKERKDSVTLAYLAREDVQELFDKFQVKESYKVSKVDSTGMTIASPIEGRYKDPKPSILKLIFGVKGDENHGSIERGDRSWSENK